MGSVLMMVEPQYYYPFNMIKPIPTNLNFKNVFKPLIDFSGGV